MTTDIKELVKRLDAGRTLLLRADGDRDLGFQSNTTTDVSMALADGLKSAIVALEALAGEVENQKCFAVAEQPRAELAEAERDRLKAAITEALNNAQDRLDYDCKCKDCTGTLTTVEATLREALGDAS